MNIAIVMGRGIEGCGVTKFTVEQTKWLDKNGYNFTVYSSKDKSWTRKNAHDVSHVVQLKFAKKEEMDKMIAGCNNADVVIINSLPSLSHPEAAVDQFKRFLNEVTKPVVLIQHDHSSLSIKRNAAINESIRKASVLFGHSRRNDFCSSSITSSCAQTTSLLRLKALKNHLHISASASCLSSMA